MSSCSRTTLLLLFVMTTAAITTLCFATSPHIDEGPVCGLDHQTYESYETAQAANVNVMHCGNCGACSNALDIQIYRETKNTLTEKAKRCAIQNLLFGKRAGTKCMIQSVGFTDNCLDCWMQNIACTLKHCTTTCLKFMLFGKEEFHEHLNPCFACDEFKCGPKFVECAGANRRRAGITSDIHRRDEEVCTLLLT